MKLVKKIRRRMSYTRMIALGFLAIILTGSILLSMPFATRSGESMPYVDALFTAASATCVTGLVVVDTYTNWNLFGQLVILSLIQIGGLGFITIGVYVAVIFKKRIGLKSREAIHESVNTMESAGAVRLTKKIITGTFMIELVGGLLLATKFIPRLGIVKGLYFGIFHAISAFCNAGFDLMGYWEEYASFTGYYDDILVNATLMILIIIGGVGFIVWDDVIRNKWNFRKYLLHSKVVISTTFVLIFGGAFFFWIFERNLLFAQMDGVSATLASLFSSVTARTAGFNTVDTAALSNPSKMLTIILMFIGGSPGSTAGGIKTTTIVVMFISVWAMVRSTYGTNIFGRRLHEESIKKASTVFMINLTLGMCAIICITSFQILEFSDVMFEVFSAIGTVGMTTGITRDLTVASKILITLLMYTGRLGSLSFAVLLTQRKVIPPVLQPEEKMIVG